MKNGYKKAITDRMKESVNNWIETLKKEHLELLLTKQWQILFPKGFRAGHNVLAVVTGSKKGKHLIGEVQFVLPDSLDLDFDDIELVFKNEPFKERLSLKAKRLIPPVPIDEPLDVLNELVLGVNDFLQNLNLKISATKPLTPSPLFPTEKQQAPVRQISGALQMEPALPFQENDTNLIEKVKEQMLKSIHLPQWIKTIESKEVYEGLMQKLSEGFIHYGEKLGKAVDLKEFFDKYTEHLKAQDKLYPYCKYKSKPVKLDSNDWCLESYCSKKPFNSPCPQATVKFGSPPE